MSESKTVLAFDVYGTLIDTAGVVAELRTVVGDRAEEFSRIWRDKQLEYSFRRALMRRYVDFAVCVEQSFDLTAALLGASPTAEQRQRLLGAFTVLPAFDDVAACLDQLEDSGFGVYALSNGSASAVETLLTEAGIRTRFDDIVSVEEVTTFKPDPAVYDRFLERADVAGADAWLISGNPFDVIGAVSAGMRAVWVRRSEAAVFDPWEIQPTLTVPGLIRLRDRIEQFNARR
ncbi:MAG: haloacid dehalogenase type II [Gammaproteobacteria bacterium]